MRRAVSLVLLTFALLPVSSSQARTGSISILNTEPLKVSGEKGKNTVDAKFSVLNSGPATPINVEFQASSNEKVHVQTWDPHTLLPGANRLAVTLEGVEDLNEAATGQLVIEGGESPVAQSIEVDPAPPDTYWSLGIILGGLAAALAIVGFVLLFLIFDSKVSNLAEYAPDPKWEISNWATTLTALGAAFGTVLGAATFPQFPERVSSAELVNLNILFGVMVLVGPFLFETLRGYTIRIRSAEARTKGTGKNWTMLIASAFTLWAAVGQMGALGLLGWELLGGKGIGADVVLGAAAIAILLACWYFFTTMSDQVRRGEDGSWLL